jgi:hypothetical protein
MRRSGIVVVGLSCLMLPAIASAQGRAIASPGQGRGVGPQRAIPIDRDQIGIIAIDPFEIARPVTGAPYIAEALTETTQELADGNRIQQRTTASIARDSKGRIRREQQAIALAGRLIESPTPLVTISDPETGTHVTLDAARRVALRARMPTPTAALNAALNNPAAGSRAIVGGSERTDRLGERRIEGMRAEGIRTTMTIEANAIGNRAPITVVSERWYSPELQVIVLTRRLDPRFGETLYQLTKIVRTEPPEELFTVPDDYRIEELAPGIPRRR